MVASGSTSSSPVAVTTSFPQQQPGRNLTPTQTGPQQQPGSAAGASAAGGAGNISMLEQENLKIQELQNQLKASQDRAKLLSMQQDQRTVVGTSGGNLLQQQQQQPGQPGLNNLVSQAAQMQQQRQMNPQGVQLGQQVLQVGPGQMPSGPQAPTSTGGQQWPRNITFTGQQGNNPGNQFMQQPGGQQQSQSGPLLSNKLKEQALLRSQQMAGVRMNAGAAGGGGGQQPQMINQPQLRNILQQVQCPHTSNIDFLNLSV